MSPPRTSGLTGAERLRRGAKALYWLVAVTAYGIGVATGWLIRPVVGMVAVVFAPWWP